MTKSLRRLICRILAGVMLLSQLMIAAHACPVQASGMAPMQAMADAAGAMAGTGPDGDMADCEQMGGQVLAPTDTASPNLCAGHCRFGEQSDQVNTPALPAAVPISLYTVPPVPEARVPSSPSAASAAPTPAGSPPLAVLLCRYRD